MLARRTAKLPCIFLYGPSLRHRFIPRHSDRAIHTLLSAHLYAPNILNGLRRRVRNILEEKKCVSKRYSTGIPCILTEFEVIDIV